MRLKKYFVFILSFIVLFVGFQLLSGAILTALYTPDFSAIGGGFSQEVEFGKTNAIPLLGTLLVATLAYFLSQKVFKAAK
jgi:hypothetical protein